MVKAITTLVFFAGGATFDVVAADAGDTERPNILFIFADDWGWGDLSCHGHPYVKTPNIDRLAKEGTDFQRFTVASGVCSPSRTAVMTGHFPARYAIDGHFAWVPSNVKRGMPDWLDPASPLMPRMLQSAGYRTAHFGKWYLANNMIPDSPLPVKYCYDRAWANPLASERSTPIRGTSTPPLRSTATVQCSPLRCLALTEIPLLQQRALM